jgi:hypothetical protein
MTRLDLENVAQGLEDFPTALRETVARLPEEIVRRKKSRTEFSIVENICHLRDIERDGYSVRLRRLLDEAQPFLSDLDGARLARERDYNSQPIQSAIEEFSNERMANVELIRALRPEQLSRTGHLETVGPISLEQLLGRMQEHDREHLELIEGLRSESGR